MKRVFRESPVRKSCNDCYQLQGETMYKDYHPYIVSALCSITIHMTARPHLLFVHKYIRIFPLTFLFFLFRVMLTAASALCRSDRAKVYLYTCVSWARLSLVAIPTFLLYSSFPRTLKTTARVDEYHTFVAGACAGAGTGDRPPAPPRVRT